MIIDNLKGAVNTRVGYSPANGQSSETLPEYNISEWGTIGRGLSSLVRMLSDGRIAVSLNLQKKLPDLPKDHALEVKEFAVDDSGWRSVPNMNIVFMIVGSRGDVQPYVALGKLLKSDGHRVRIATHDTFRTFVKEHGLEFFDIGGNPHDLMSYMVKNPGLVPGFESMRNGDIKRKRKMLKELINGCWLACHSPSSKTGLPFAADAIISNPPAFAHIHCAQALGIPLLMSFTMPWTATTAFCHPLVNIADNNAEKGLANFLSYALADLLTWQGIGDIINKFRVKSLGLRSLNLESGPGVLDTTKVPWTYCMSPGLIPKPPDWKNHIDVVGFYFLDLADRYVPQDALVKFLECGDTPIYIGFGSIVVDDSNRLTQTIFEATRRAGVRALVSAGWGGLGNASVPSHIFILGNVPHDWLFSDNRVKAVIHHGGAGTTAIGLANGRPTAVIPFFGDQAFWGHMIHKAGAGPEPISHKALTIDNLTNAIKYLVSPSALNGARKLGQQIRSEDGTKKGAQSFYQHLPLLNMRCDMDPSRIAVWWSTEHCLKLSSFAAQTLSDANLIDMGRLDPHRSKEYVTRKAATDPFTGTSNAVFWTVTNYLVGVAELFYSPASGLVHTTTALPKGMLKIVQSVQEGLNNAPKLYGSKVREHEKAKDFKSGVIEAGKGVVLGCYDGVTGLVREPINGAKKEGLAGFVKGSARSCNSVVLDVPKAKLMVLLDADLVMKPAAAGLGVVVHPVEGAYRNIRAKSAKKITNVHQEVRRLEGIEQARNSTSQQRDEIVHNFMVATTSSKARLKTFNEMASAELEDEQDEVTKGLKSQKPDTFAPPSYAESTGEKHRH